MKAVVCLAVLALSVPYAFAEEKENDGQDLTRPLTRFDLRILYTSGIPVPGQSDADQLTMIGRIDKPMPLKNGWVFYYRTDVPFVHNDVPSKDNVDGDWQTGVGDWFNQFIMIAPQTGYPLGIKTFGIGAQLVLDTASQDQFGAGQNMFVPLVAWKWQLSEAVELIPIFKYELGWGNREDNDNRRDIENFQFKPLVNVSLPDRWFLTLYDTADWTLQKDGGDNDGDWSIPVDLMIGRTFGGGSSACLGITERCVYSAQYIDYIVDDLPAPDWQVQLRIGWFF